VLLGNNTDLVYRPRDRRLFTNLYREVVRRFDSRQASENADENDKL
jgi:hypothetical protein